ncbi:MAG: EamA family transporter, partial [Pseudomonadota bacterium]
GILCGFACVALILWPEARLPNAGLALWIAVALVPSLLYAMEGNIIAKWGDGWGLDPIQMLTGASILGAPMTLMLASVTGQYIDPIRPWGAPEWALVISAALHAVVYASYFWTVTRAGIVFASQVSYLITGFGVVIAMVVLGERYALHIWAGLGLMLVGLALVQPRPKSGLVPGRAMQDNDR